MIIFFFVIRNTGEILEDKLYNCFHEKKGCSLRTGRGDLGGRGGAAVAEEVMPTDEQECCFAS